MIRKPPGSIIQKDEYLAHCKKRGKKPDREYSGTIFVRTDPEIHRELSLEAEKRGKSLNEYVIEKLVGTKRA